jgi:hypothetical protein
MMMIAVTYLVEYLIGALSQGHCHLSTYTDKPCTIETKVMMTAHFVNLP